MVFTILIYAILSYDFSFNEPTNFNNKISLWGNYSYYPGVESNSTGISIRTITEEETGVKFELQKYCEIVKSKLFFVNNVNNGETYVYDGESELNYVDCSSYFPNNPEIGKYKFKKLNGVYGTGENNYFLIPFRTIGVDTNKIPIGSVVYIPQAKGISFVTDKGETKVHDGYFFAGYKKDTLIDNHIEFFIGENTNDVFSFVKNHEWGVFDGYLVDDSNIKNQLIKAHELFEQNLSGTIEFTEPINGQTYQDNVIFKVNVTGDVKIVKYFLLNGSLLGVSNDSSNNYQISHIFSTNGVKKVIAKGYNIEGFYIMSADKEVEITVENSIPCENECVLNSKKCNENGNPEVCTDIEGCLIWVSQLQCSENQECESGICKDIFVCENECELNEKICVSQESYNICYTDENGCLKWGYQTWCEEDEECKNNNCSKVEPTETKKSSSGCNFGGKNNVVSLLIIISIIFFIKRKYKNKKQINL